MHTRGDSPLALELRDVSLSFAAGLARVKVLDSVCFVLPRGTVLGLLGPSGCGKSTLLRVMAGLVRPDSGSIRVFGKTPAPGSPQAAYVPQRVELLPWKTLSANAVLGWELAHHSAATAEARDRAGSLLTKFGICGVADHFPTESSGGERQRAALVRALLSGAPLLLLDEPLSAIDHLTRATIYETLDEIIAERAQDSPPLTSVIVSHDPEELLLLCDFILALSARPANALRMIEVTFPRPRRHELRFHPAFVEQRRVLWSLLP